jgi:Fe-S-cluster containining protein
MQDKNILKICQDCGAKCCKLGGVDATNSERKRILNRGYPDHFLKIDEDHYEMNSKKARCPYLNKDNSCSIYEVRPLPCRCFPVHPEYENNKKKYLLALCPLGRVLPQNIIKGLRKESAKIRNHIIKNRFSHTNLSKSEIKVIIKRLNKFKEVDIR